MNEMPIVFKNSRQDDVEKLLRKARESYEALKEDETQDESGLRQEKPITKKRFRQEKIKQVIISEIK